MQNINYPYQVASVKQEKNGEKKTLGIDAQLSLPNAENDTEKSMPLEMHSGYSRFVVTLIKKTDKETIFPKANIPAEEVPFIFEKTKIAMQNLVSSKINAVNAASSGLSIAYTEKFAMGNFKGKSPAEILLENPENEEALIKQGEFLNQNVNKFPANKKKIEAIKDAIKLFKEGKLEKKEGVEVAPNIIEIYNEQIKALRSTKDENNRYLVYGIKITCDTSRNLPFCLEISNCRCPVDFAESGIMNPRMKEAINVQKVAINLTEKDWYKVIRRMNATLENFEITGFKHQLKVANDASFRNAEAAKQQGA